ncbi:MAG: hypothetical protein A2075_11640 [Geobacteraceae bacterium GWC2_58_44]|nr:MAG: hypothetical protein A2075_11640 [Geobacteraceae bacterium GWC2_58_44]HBG04797.1 hypothetical protein [Geobacter sp.]
MDLVNKASSRKYGCRPKGITNRMSRLADLLSAIQEMTETEFTGHIKINFSQGGIGRIEKYEEILRNAQNSE